MKKFINAAVLSTMLVLGVASYAQAGDAARASIPFEFVVNNTTFPAGNYAVVGTSNPRIAILRNEQNPRISTIVVLSNNSELLGDGKAEFQVKRKSAPEQAGYQGVR